MDPLNSQEAMNGRGTVRARTLSTLFSAEVPA